MMGGQIDWSALPIVAEMLGISDIEQFILHLLTIKSFQTDNG